MNTTDSTETNEYQPKHLRKPTALSTCAEERLDTLRTFNPWAPDAISRARNRVAELSRRVDEEDPITGFNMEDLINTLDAEIHALIIIMLDHLDTNVDDYFDVLRDQIQYLTDPENM